MRKKLVSCLLVLSLLLLAVPAGALPPVQAETVHSSHTHDYVDGVCAGCGQVLFTVAQDFSSGADVMNASPANCYALVGNGNGFGTALNFFRTDVGASVTVDFDVKGTAEQEALVFWYDVTSSVFGADAAMSFIPYTTVGSGITMSTGYTYYTVVDGEVSEQQPTTNFTLQLPIGTKGWMILPLPAPGTWQYDYGTGNPYYGTCYDLASVYLEFIYYIDASVVVDQFGFTTDIEAFSAAAASGNENIPGYTEANCDTDGHAFSAPSCDAPGICSICGTTQGSALGHTYANNNVCTVCGEVDVNCFTFARYGGELHVKGYDGSYAQAVLPAAVNGYPVTAIETWSFANCDTLIKLTLPDSVTSIGNSAFLDCNALAEIDFGNGLVTIGEGAFANCGALREVVLPATFTSLGQRAFASNFSLQEIRVDEANAVFTASEGVLFDKGMTRLICYPPAKQPSAYTVPDSVTVIGDGAFHSSNRLESILLPDSVVEIGSRAFESCTSLKTFAIPKSVTYMGDSVFSGCNHLESVTVAEENAAFCAVDGVLFSKDGTRLLRYPSGKAGATYTIPTGTITVDTYAFQGGWFLRELTLPYTVTSLGDDAFFDCRFLTKITVRGNITNIGAGVFSLCKNLTLYGYENTFIQTYAAENNIPFVSFVCSHAWDDATCLAAKRCALCGQSEGDPLGHAWAEATCTTPKVCTVCGAEQGKVSEHRYVNNGFCTMCGLAFDRWVRTEGNWYYYNSVGCAVTGWQCVDGVWYYLDQAGVMQTGWEKIGNAWYYLESNGAMKTGWLKAGSVYYYLAPSGEMATGWKQVGGVWYYFNASGVMQTGWEKIGNTWYYLESNGAMKTGWLKAGSVYYYLAPSGGMTVGWKQVGGVWYYFDASGVMQTGWEKIGNTWYYLDSSGAMLTGWQNIGGTYYYFYTGGAMATSCYIGQYWVNASGAWIG